VTAFPPLADLLPHRGPSLLLGRVLDLSSTHCLALVSIEPEAWYLQSDGTAPAWVGLEWMAQAASAFSGHRHRLAGHDPRIGFLLGTRSYEALVPSFPAGAELEVEAEAIFLDEEGLGAFSCTLRHSGQTVARARLKAIEQP
jgi:predicted hotdog family 3-hydroxylacyl-ACP dehydratase